MFNSNHGVSKSFLGGLCARPMFEVGLSTLPRRQCDVTVIPVELISSWSPLALPLGRMKPREGSRMSVGPALSPLLNLSVSIPCLVLSYAN